MTADETDEVDEGNSAVDADALRDLVGLMPDPVDMVPLALDAV